MGFFGGRSKESILIEAFYKVAFEMGYIESLLCLEAGAEKSEILRDTDYFADGASKKETFLTLINVILAHSFIFRGGLSV